MKLGQPVVGFVKETCPCSTPRTGEVAFESLKNRRPGNWEIVSLPMPAREGFCRENSAVQKAIAGVESIFPRHGPDARCAPGVQVFWVRPFSPRKSCLQTMIFPWPLFSGGRGPAFGQMPEPKAKNHDRYRRSRDFSKGPGWFPEPPRPHHDGGIPVGEHTEKGGLGLQPNELQS